MGHGKRKVTHIQEQKERNVVSVQELQQKENMYTIYDNHSPISGEQYYANVTKLLS